MMFRPPQRGDRFVVPGRRGFITVEACLLGVSTSEGFSHFLVSAVDGTLWTLLQRGAGDHDVRWIGTPFATNNAATG